MPTIAVLDADGTEQTINTLPDLGAAAKAASQPVTVATDDPTVLLLTTIDADTDAIKSAVEVMDDWDESNRAATNIIVGQAGVAAGAGAVGATVQRVTLASDDPAVALLGTIDTDTGAIATLLGTIDADTGDVKTATETVAGAVSGSEMQVDVVAALPAGTNAIGKLAANTGVTIGAVEIASSQTVAVTNAGTFAVQATVAAGENHLGSVGGNTAVVGVTFSLDTSAYADGDVLADSQVLAACLRTDDGTGVLQTITLNDKDDQGIAMDIVILDANVSIGTENAAVSITDANADNILAVISVESTDWVDFVGCKVATIKNLSIPVSAVSGTDDLYVALVTRGTPTHTASGITARFGFLQD